MAWHLECTVNGTDVKGDVAEDTKYWSKVREYVKRYGKFNDEQASQRKRYYSYLC